MKQQPSSTVLRPSACPGLLRIVQAVDGGICRVKLAGGVITAEQALAVAEAAATYAGGVIEATNRANLQIRGITGDHAALIADLLDAGLGPTTAGGDDVRNLMLSPSAGIDRAMLIDTRPLAAQILSTLQTHTRLHELSAKFAVQLDGGEVLAMLEHHHDLWLSAQVRGDEVWLVFGLAGCPAHAAPVAAVPLAQGYEVVVAVLELFLDLARPDQTRMRHLLAEVAVDDFLAQLATRISVPLSTVTAHVRTPITAHLGTYPQRQPGQVYVAANAPLGRLDSTMLQGAAHLARQYGDASLRFTPWQGVLLAGLPAQDAVAVTQGLSQLGFVCSFDEPLAQLIACTGSSGCAKGLADTKADARHLAGLLPGTGPVQGIHLSGCPRTCAAAHVAPVTLLAVAAGHYDLYFCDTHFRDAEHPGFGALHARNLTIDAAGAMLRARLRSNTDD